MKNLVKPTLPLPVDDALFGLDVAGPVTAAELLPHYDQPPRDVVAAARLTDGGLFVAHLLGAVILPAGPDPQQTAMALHAAKIAGRAARLRVN